LFVKIFFNILPTLNGIQCFAVFIGVVPNAKQIAISRNFLLTQLKSYITRNIQGDEGFYPLYYKNDKTVLKALEVIRNQK
jgi:carboxyl-terminal processing protease